MRQLSGFPRVVVAVLLLPLVVVVVAACEKFVTHEPGSVYSQIVDTPNPPTGQPPDDGVTYAHVSNADVPVPAAYQGQYKAKANRTSSATGASAYGRLDADENPDDDGAYGAAFYFPPGTFTGSTPAQNGDIDIMQWRDTETGNMGGIRIKADHKAYLVKDALGTPVEDVDPEKAAFTLKEGCWNWIVARQRLRSSVEPPGSDHPVNDVYVNGAKVYASSKPNKATWFTDEGVERVGFGMVNMGTSQTRALSFYVDDAFISSETDIKPPVGAGLCKPNILFVVTDDQRIGTVEQGNWMPDVRDRFITEGTKFPNAVVTTPLCCPSRGSIMTGQYVHNHGIKRNTEINNFASGTALPSYLDPTYFTGIFGKYLNRWPLTQNPSNVDKWAIYNNGAGAGSHVPIGPTASCPTDGGPDGSWLFGISCVNENGAFPTKPSDPYETDYLASKVNTFLDEAETPDNQPWFLYLAPTQPHSPWGNDPTWNEIEAEYRTIEGLPPLARDGSYREGSSSVSCAGPAPDPSITEKPPYIQQAVESAPAGCPTGEFPYEGQFRALKSVNELVRNVFTKLNALDETQDTLAVFISDNGFLWGEHSWTGKGYPYLESVKVPFYFRWPGQALLRPSTVDNRLVANIDLAPTVLKTLGIPTIADEPMDGLNLLGAKTRDFWLLENWRNDVTIGGYFNNPPAWASILTPQYQYTEYYDDTGSLVKPIAAYPWRTSPPPGDPATAAGETQVREYYDLSGALGPPDPHQLRNLLGDNSTSNNPPPATLSGLHDKLDYERSCRGQGEVAGQDCNPPP